MAKSLQRHMGLDYGNHALGWYSRPLALLLITMFFIFSFELMIMIFFEEMPVVSSADSNGVLDALLLTVLVSPVLYLFTMRPMMRQITENHQISQDLKLAAKVFERSVQAIIITNAKAEILSVNKAFTDITGYGHDEIAGKKPSILSSGRHDRMFYDQMWASLEAQGMWSGEIWNRRKNGEVYPEYLTISVVTGRDGKLKNYIASFTDISERKEAEEKVYQLSRAIEQLGEGVLITDVNGVIQYVNPAMCEISGYGEDELVGNTPFFMSSDRHDLAFIEQMWREISSGGKWKGRVINKRKSGDTYPSMLTISPIMGFSGKIKHYVGVFQDLTEYQELESRFYQAQKMEALGTFVGGMAHDFNNTLLGITGNIFLAKSEAGDIPEAVRCLDNAEKLAFGAADVLSKLMTFSRKSEIKMEPFCMANFLEEAIYLYQASLPDEVAMRSTIRERLDVHGDPNQLQQMLVNLLNNARHAVQKSQDPCIEISLSRFQADSNFREKHPGIYAERFAHLAVKDNGHGIKEGHLERVFDPFFTTKDVGEGTGLGLAMVYGTIESHQGVIQVDSREGSGTCFNIYLPLHECVVR